MFGSPVFPALHQDWQVLIATFRSRLAGLVRRTRCLLRRERGLWTGVYLVGAVYNFYSPHRSLRQRFRDGTRRWQERNPAMAAGLTEHVWTVAEALHCRVPPKRIDLSRWRGTYRKGALPTTRGASRGVQTTITV